MQMSSDSSLLGGSSGSSCLGDRGQRTYCAHKISSCQAGCIITKISGNTYAITMFFKTISFIHLSNLYPVFLYICFLLFWTPNLSPTIFLTCPAAASKRQEEGGGKKGDEVSRVFGSVGRWGGGGVLWQETTDPCGEHCSIPTPQVTALHPSPLLLSLPLFIFLTPVPLFSKEQRSQNLNCEYFCPNVIPHTVHL